MEGQNTQPGAADDGPDLSGIDIPAGDRNGNAYEQLCAAWHSNPCGDTLAAIGSAILALRPIYEPPLHDDILILEKANEFLPDGKEQGEWPATSTALSASLIFLVFVANGFYVTFCRPNPVVSGIWTFALIIVTGYWLKP